jgi:hypothetical protein
MKFARSCELLTRGEFTRPGNSPPPEPVRPRGEEVCRLTAMANIAWRWQSRCTLASSACAYRPNPLRRSGIGGQAESQTRCGATAFDVAGRAPGRVSKSLGPSALAAGQKLWCAIMGLKQYVPTYHATGCATPRGVFVGTAGGRRYCVALQLVCGYR